jgi:hypothetical protein
LSWPRRNDTRRAVVGPTPKQSRLNRIRAEYRLVNTSCLDIELHDLVSSSTKTYGISLQGVVKSVPDAANGEPPNRLGKSLSLPRGPTLGTNIRLSSLDKVLFQYCETPLPLPHTMTKAYTTLSCSQSLILYYSLWA